MLAYVEIQLLEFLFQLFHSKYELYFNMFVLENRLEWNGKQGAYLL